MEEIIKQNIELEKIVLNVAEIAKYLWQNGWAERNAGNISVNINDILNFQLVKLGYIGGGQVGGQIRTYPTITPISIACLRACPSKTACVK